MHHVIIIVYELKLVWENEQGMLYVYAEMDTNIPPGCLDLNALVLEDTADRKSVV